MGKLNLPRKRTAQELIFDEELDFPLEEEDADEDKKLQCLVRNFLLVQAYNHQCYNSQKMLVALPRIFKCRYSFPLCRFHERCLTSPPVDGPLRLELNKEKSLYRAVKQ